MKNTPVLIIVALFTLTSCFTLFELNEKYKLNKAPTYNKGTFWKETSTQLTTQTGQEANYRVSKSCYIDGASEYKGHEVYESTVLIHEEKKIFKVFIDKKNLKIEDAIGIWDHYNDTMTLEFELLNFPLYAGKKWKSICKYQEFPNKSISQFDGSFEVLEIRDTVVIAGNEKISTKAFFLTGKLTSEDKTSTSDYVYLAPTKSFPGTCPVFLWQAFFKGLDSGGPKRQIIHNYSIMDFNW